MVNKKLSIAVASLIALSACTKGPGSKPGMRTISVNSESILEDQSLTPQEKAEKLALAAEQLLTPASFMYADEVASAALNMDPENKRAQLIKVLVGPTMATRGILERVKPIANRNQETQKEYAETLEAVSKMPNTAIKTFLLDSKKQDIRNEADIQSFVGSIVKAFDNARLFFKKNKDLEITLNIPSELLQKEILDKRTREECVAQKVDEGKYELNCDLSEALQIKVNRADIEVAQQITAGYQIYGILLNAYRYDGSIAYQDAIKADKSKPTNEQEMVQLLKNAQFGTLRDEKGMKQILEMGLDAITGIRYAQQNQATLCKLGKDDEKNRKGFLAKNGLCVPSGAVNEDGDSLDAVLQLAELGFRGGNLMAEVTSTSTNQTLKTEVRPAALFMNPVQDIRNLGFVYSSDGSTLVDLRDKTAGGVFVRGDLDEVTKIKDSNFKIKPKR